MVARSFSSAAENPSGPNVVKISIGGDHPLNDPNPPTYGSDRDRAASLMLHVRSQLTHDNPIVREVFWNELRATSRRIEANGPAATALRNRLADRYAAAQRGSAIPLTDAQIDAAATVSMEKRAMRHALGDSHSAEETEQMIDTIIARSVRKASGQEFDPLANPPPQILPHIERIDAAVAAIYADTAEILVAQTADFEGFTVLRNEGEAPRLAILSDEGNIIPVSPQRQADLTNEIVRSSIAVDAAEAAVSLDPSTARLLGDAVAARLALHNQISEITLGNNTATQRGDAAALRNEVDRFARNQTTEMSPYIAATALEAQQARYDAMATANPTQAQGFVFRTDLAASLNEILTTETFGVYKNALDGLQKSGNDRAAGMVDEQFKRAEQALSRSEIVMASRPQALVMESWIAFATTSGNLVPPTNQIELVADMLDKSYGRQIVEPRVVPEAVCPVGRDTDEHLKTLGLNFPKVMIGSTMHYVAKGDQAARLATLENPPKDRGDLGANTTAASTHDARIALARAFRGKMRRRLITQNVVQRQAYRGPDATGLKFPTIAIEGMRYFRNGALIEAGIKDIAEANKKVPAYQRAAMITTVRPDSKAFAAIQSGAEKAGFETMPLEVVPTKLSMINSADQRKTVDRSVQMNLIVKDGDATRSVDLYSTEGQRLARGKLLLMTARAQTGGKEAEFSAQKAQMVCWQAMQSIASQVRIYGDDAQDYNIAQTARRAMDLGRTISIVDQSGNSVDPKAFYPKAVANAPQRNEIAGHEMSANNAIKLSEPIAQVLLAKHLPAEAIQTVSRNAETIGDLVELANTSATQVKTLDPETRRGLIQTMTALGTLGPAMRDPLRYGKIMNDAEMTAKAMNERGLKLETTGPLAEAYGRPVYSTGPTLSAEDRNNPIAARNETQGKFVALIGGTQEYGQATHNVVDAAVKRLASDGNVILTTAERGIGDLVINSAIANNARLVVFSQDHDLKQLPFQTSVALRNAENVTIVSSQDPAVTRIWRDGEERMVSRPEDRRGLMLNAATQASDSIILGAARENDMAALIAVEAGQVRPVAVLPVQAENFADYSANLALLRQAGSISAAVTSNSLTTIALAEGDNDIGQRRDNRSRPQKDLIQVAHVPIVRVASWNQPAQMINNLDAINSFLTNGKPLREETPKSMTAADMARHYGLVRAPTEFERAETGNRGIIIAQSTADQAQLMEKAMNQLRQAQNVRVVPRSAGHSR